MASTSKSVLAFRRAHRAYATLSNHSAAESAQASSAASKIKERRVQTENEYAKSNVQIRSLSVEEKRSLVRPPVNEHSSQLRGRLRGIRQIRRKDGTTSEQVVGQRIYLPNIIFTLVRNQTPAGKAYNPYEATFRIPQNITKTDVRNYLHALYGVESTYIRTDNYLVPMKHAKAIATGRIMDKGIKKAYKRAVVGLKEPFYFPQMVEDMNGRDRWLRETELENQFRIKEWKEIQTAASVKAHVGIKGTNNIPDLASVWATKKKVIRKLWEQREEREKLTRDIAEKLDKSRD